MPAHRVGLNPLPWVLTRAGFTMTVPVLRNAFAEITTTPFRGKLDLVVVESEFTLVGVNPGPRPVQGARRRATPAGRAGRP